MLHFSRFYKKRSTWNYLPIYMSRTLISLGDTPDILEACPIDLGLIFANLLPGFGR